MKNNKGITLIALIVTIIVMAILISVSIRMSVGKNSVITEAKITASDVKKEELKARIEEKILALQMKNQGKIRETELQTILNEYGSVSGNKLVLKNNEGEILLSDLYSDSDVGDPDIIEPLPRNYVTGGNTTTNTVTGGNTVTNTTTTGESSTKISAGTYRFNSTLTAPSATYEEYINFSFVGQDAGDVLTKITLTAGSSGSLAYFTNTGFGFYIAYAYSASRWSTEYPNVRTITISSDATVSEGFKTWFNANAVKQ